MRRRGKGNKSSTSSATLASFFSPGLCTVPNHGWFGSSNISTYTVRFSSVILSFVRIGSVRNHDLKILRFGSKEPNRTEPCTETLTALTFLGNKNGSGRISSACTPMFFIHRGEYVHRWKINWLAWTHAINNTCRDSKSPHNYHVITMFTSPFHRVITYTQVQQE